MRGFDPELEPRARRTIIRFRAEEVREVRVRGDSLANGAVIGLLVGGTLGAVAAGNFAGGGFRAGDAVQGALILGGVGLGIGVTSDALIAGSRLVYRAPPAVASTPDRASAALVWYAGVRW